MNVPAIGLGVSQIMGYGCLMYAYAVLLPHMATDLGLSLSEVFGILSLGLMLAGFAILLSFGFTLVGVIFAAALYGMGDGIKTIARGTLPLAMFGAKGFGARLGWISFVQMGINASAPFMFAWMTQTFGGWWSFLAMAMCLCAAIATYVLIPDPRRPS